MALQSTSHPMFAQVPDEFFSPFPSNDSLMSGKYQALTRATSKLSEELATMQQAKAFNITLQILQKTRATKAGDLLTDWLPEDRLVQGGGGRQAAPGDLRRGAVEHDQ
jgi:hypothetical protein